MSLSVRALAGRLSLSRRLFTAQALVVLTGGITLALVTAVVGPTIFHDHLRRASGHVDPEAAGHVEQAYASATTVSLAISLLAALAAALAVSAYIARRVSRPISELASAATEVAEGRYDARVPAPGMGREFDTVADAFNAMAGRLSDVETTRRRLLSDLSHELRTPLATMEAYVDAAEDAVIAVDESTWTVLRTQVARMRRLSDDIAAVSRAEEHQLDLHPHRVSPEDLVRVAVAAAQTQYDAKGVDLGSRTQTRVGDVEADAERIGQVLGNLLDNALRHTPAGGSVTIALDEYGDKVRFAVTDTGEGIPTEHLPHIFERFYRVSTARDRAHGGSGIGLAIVRAIVTEHGGTVEARSDGPGTGTCITVELPAAQRQP
jgi:signal transduction histidine kinase